LPTLRAAMRVLLLQLILDLGERRHQAFLEAAPRPVNRGASSCCDGPLVGRPCGSGDPVARRACSGMASARNSLEVRVPARAETTSTRSRSAHALRVLR